MDSRRDRLGIGVIGLGRLWEARHKPALLRRPDRIRVAAVYDQVALRASMEARALRCAAAEGLVELIARPDVDAMFLLTPQWFGLHPIELACRAGKPIYCALPLGATPAALEAVAPAIRQSGVPFVPELPRRAYPATRRLLELIATRLGPARLVLGQARLFGFDRYGDPGPSTQLVPTSLLIDPGANLADWCRVVFGGEPETVSAAAAVASNTAGGDAPDYEGLTLGFAGGRTAQIAVARYDRAAWGEATRFLPAPGFQVYCERGAAWVEMPDRIQWSDPEGVHDERLPMEPTVGELLCDGFLSRVRGEESAAPGLDDALAVARIVAALRSGESTRPIIA